MDIVDDIFWLNHAKQVVEQSNENANAAAKKLQDTTAWFWTVYSSLLTAGVLTKTISVPLWPSILLFAPIVLLIPTYWCCTLAQMPIKGDFNPRIPDEIRKNYNKGIAVKKRRYNLALTSSVLAMISLSIGIITLLISSEYSISASLNHDKNLLFVSGELPQNKIISISVDSVTLAQVKMPVYRKEIILKNHRDLYLNFPIKQENTFLIVSAVWEEDNIRQGLLRYIAPH